MRVFQELEIEAKEMDDVIGILEELSQEAWERNHDAESRLKQAGVIQYAFRYTGTKLPPANLFLLRINERYRVTNVVPEKRRELKMHEYNGLLVDFFQRISQSKQLRARMTKPEQQIEDFFSTDAATALRSFSALANMSSGRLHPNDEKRWIDFIYKAARDKADVDASIMHGLLMDEGWDEETALQLSSDYESSLSAVKYALEQEKCA